LADWKRSDPIECGDDIQAEANACAQRLEAQYSDDDLLRIIRAHGVDDTLATPTVVSPEEANVPLPEGEV
jgi:hypothetical protein